MPNILSLDDLYHNIKSLCLITDDKNTQYLFPYRKLIITEKDITLVYKVISDSLSQYIQFVEDYRKICIRLYSKDMNLYIYLDSIKKPNCKLIDDNIDRVTFMIVSTTNFHYDKDCLYHELYCDDGIILYLDTTKTFIDRVTDTPCQLSDIFEYDLMQITNFGKKIYILLQSSQSYSAIKLKLGLLFQSIEKYNDCYFAIIYDKNWSNYTIPPSTIGGNKIFIGNILFYMYWYDSLKYNYIKDINDCDTDAKHAYEVLKQLALDAIQ